jgi:hypothetical protein
MRLRKKSIGRLALAGAAAVVAVGLAAPLVDAHRFGARVKAGPWGGKSRSATFTWTCSAARDSRWIR